jgi:hypothetical protein
VRHGVRSSQPAIIASEDYNRFTTPTSRRWCRTCVRCRQAAVVRR